MMYYPQDETDEAGFYHNINDKIYEVIDLRSPFIHKSVDIEPLQPDSYHLRPKLLELFYRAGWRGDGWISQIILPAYIFEGTVGLVKTFNVSGDGKNWLIIPKVVHNSHPVDWVDKDFSHAKKWSDL